MEHFEVKNTIKQWSIEERPREKLLEKGKESLTNSELLAIIIGSGNTEETAVELSKKLLKNVNDNLIELSKLKIEELKKFKGIGEAKAISIIAALELSQRTKEEEFLKRDKIKNSVDIYNIMVNYFSSLNYEEFWIFLLNRSNKIIKKVKLSRGGTSGTYVDIKIVFKYALDNLASAIILCHNHPSGNKYPSDCDKKITSQIKSSGDLLGINVLDHVIVSEKEFYSFADEGIL